MIQVVQVVKKIEQKKQYLDKIVEEKKKITSKEEELLNEAKQFFNQYKKEIGNQLKGDCDSISINFIDLTEFSLVLSDELLINPDNTLKIFEIALEDSGLVSSKGIRVRIINLSKERKIFIENLRAENVNELVMVEGRVVSITDVRPQVVSAKFECPSCGTIITVLQKEKRFREPKRCSCGRRGGFKLFSKVTINVARIILEDLQEKTDNPHTRRLDIFVREDLTKPKNIKIFTPGNELKIVGVLKEIPIPIQGGGNIS